MQSCNENWYPVPGTESRYEVSDQGRVRSLWCSNGWRKLPKILKCSPDADGYPRFTALGKYIKVHVALMRAVYGPPEEGMEVCHKNGNRSDCRLINLEYGTHSKNMGEDRLRDGTDNSGMKNGMVAINPELISQIIASYEPGVTTQREIAARYGCSQQHVSDILSGRRRARG